jgi:hypothetical protein
VSDFVDVREPQTEKLLFRYSPNRDIIEVQRRGVKTLVDLRQYQENGLSREAPQRLILEQTSGHS